MKRMIALFVCLVLVAGFLVPSAVADETAVVTLKAEKSGNQIVVTVNTSNGIIPEGLTVELFINGSSTAHSSTTVNPSNRTAKFSCPDEARSAEVKSRETTADGIVYAASVKTAVDMHAQLSFAFSESRRELSGSQLKVYWNRDESENGQGRLVSAVFDDTTVAAADTANPAVFDVASLIPSGVSVKTYRVKWYIDEGNGAVEVTAAELQLGTLKTTMTMAEQGNNKVLVTLKDQNGQPVAGAVLSFKIGSNPAVNGTTDAQGQVVFDLFTGVNQKDVNCTFAQATIGTVTYQGSSANLAGSTTTTTTTGNETTTTTENTTTTTTENTTTTTGPQGGNTTVPTEDPNVTVTGAGTTAIIDQMVAINALYDNGILNSFGVQNAGFANYARLLMSQADYAAFVQNGGLPMFSIRSSKLPVTNQFVSTAILRNRDLADYSLERVKWVAAELSMVLFHEDGSESIISLDGTQTLTVRLPIPAGMKDYETYAVAIVSENGLTTPSIVPAREGYVEFQIQSWASYVVLGFQGDTEKAGGFPIGTVLLLIGGLLLLVAAIILLYVFVMRKGRPEEEAYDGVTGGGYISLTDTDDEASSSRVYQQPVADEEIEPVPLRKPVLQEEESIDFDHPRKNPRDYDIEL